MFGRSHSYAQHSSHSGSLCFDWPCFGSHNLWLQDYIHGDLFLIIQILAQGSHSVGQIYEVWMRVRSNVGRVEIADGGGDILGAWLLKIT